MKKIVLICVFMITLLMGSCVNNSEPIFSTIANIYESEIENEYETTGVVVGVNKESFLLEDSTGRILVFLGNTWDSSTVSIGDEVNVSGKVVSYANSIQFDRNSDVEVVKNGVYSYPEPKDLIGSDLIEYNDSKIMPEYVKLEGLLSVGEEYCNILFEESLTIGNISYPISKGELLNYSNKTVVVTGYITGKINSYLNILYTDIYVDGNSGTAGSDISGDTLKDGKCEHEFSGNTCSSCGTLYDEYIFKLFGDETIVYTNNVTNPYNINLNSYGSNVRAIFYEPKLNVTADPYKNVSSTSFYNNYSEATSYEDAYYRTKHHLISGDKTPQGHIPAKSNYDNTIRCTTATYVLDYSGNYIAYILNGVNGEKDIVYYGAGYTSLNEVAAYLLAFGNAPVNNDYDKSSTGQKQAISDWGIYGRVNISYFSGNTNSHPYEPALPKIANLRYLETDFGTNGGYVTQNSYTGTRYTQNKYNTGKKITRGAARFCFVSYTSTKNIDNRYVFYTYNHYNDFQEYLNYINGFGVRFGNESAGNPYCSDADDFYESQNYVTMKSPTSYPETILKSIYEMVETN